MKKKQNDVMEEYKKEENDFFYGLVNWKEVEKLTENVEIT